jgi:hypothetical protein
MAKRRKKSDKKQSTTIPEFIQNHQALLMKLMWGLVVGLSVLYGVSQAYPLIAAGQVQHGLLIGVVYGGGALLAISAAYYINRKLKGL